ncbi:histidine kinase [Flavobacterium album]|uniref:histidine kinase n=1 Tax=Flavobacterium album TaxID=2175091 RepID=A0A2S1QW79_9FLAO|nr:ATP-binding protein [Flavobacterium album]AWH84672.1 histidine kinase [Flavobacterium album]
MKLYQKLFIRLAFIIGAVGLCLWAYQNDLIYTSVLCFVIFLGLLAELFAIIRTIFQFYDKTISAILNNDFSADFSKHNSSDNYKNLFRLYNSLKDKENDAESKDLVYRAILNNIETGVLILQKDRDDWNIFLMNDYFSKHFIVPKVSKWSYLKNQLPALCHVIEEREFGEIRSTLQIRVDKQDTQTFMLQSSMTRTYDKDYYIILLDSIQKVIEKKEKEAWINLMKVISHELMNSVTPIRSLTQNLNELVQQESLSKDDLDDIRQSVSTMLHRSDHLQNFIESYRKLAMLPTPNKEKTDLTTLLGSVLNIMAPLFKKANITVTNSVTLNRWLMIDRLQMEQVLINLLTNSIYALDGMGEKHIDIATEIKNKRVFIIITDTGNGIDAAIEDKIFLPFFTTRKEGAGIGLTLSKNIVEAHGGYLSFDTDNERTRFVICLLE